MTDPGGIASSEGSPLIDEAAIGEDGDTPAANDPAKAVTSAPPTEPLVKVSCQPLAKDPTPALPPADETLGQSPVTAPEAPTGGEAETHEVHH